MHPDFGGEEDVQGEDFTPEDEFSTEDEPREPETIIVEAPALSISLTLEGLGDQNFLTFFLGCNLSRGANGSIYL